MNHAFRPAMMPDEFLGWERRQELRWEFDGVRPYAMTGGTVAHAAICANLIITLGNHLRGSPCRPYGMILKVQAGKSYRYPDALVTCTPASPGSDIAPDPIVLFEVLSKSTAQVDVITKLREYRSVPSVQRYVLLEQDQVVATVYTRSAAGWLVDQHLAGAALAMPEIGIEIPIDELYADVAFPDASEMGSEEP